ncbi:acyltransferase-domain-containing protein, partial [Paraphysoderma sedebokerense]
VFMHQCQTWTDWVYIWVFAHYANASKAMKIVLKESPKYIPIMGWGMMFFEFIFLKRSWSLDKHNLINAMKRICSKRQAKEPLWLLLFPEGTVWTEDTKAKSASFAKKNDLTQPSYTLLPRSTGLYTILSHLQDTVSHMYDLTIGFSGSTPTTYPNDQYKLRSVFCDGLYPSRIFIHI